MRVAWSGFVVGCALCVALATLTFFDTRLKNDINIHIDKTNHGENRLHTTSHNSVTTWMLTLFQSLNVIHLVGRISLIPYLCTNAKVECKNRL